MPRRTQGSVYRTKEGFGVRWPEGENAHTRRALEPRTKLDGGSRRTSPRAWTAGTPRRPRSRSRGSASSTSSAGAPTYPNEPSPR